ncbi:MAG: hypothetical protein M0R74_09810 [Dehalococcoidia bacterium]|nr:hypothetical protein [Dehalococcoidia bacterium]
MKYEKGDKVKVRSDLKPGEIYGGVGFVEKMSPYCGKVIEITHVEKSDSTYKADDYWWTDEMFEDLAEPRRIKAYDLMKAAAENPPAKPVSFEEAMKALDNKGKTVEWRYQKDVVTIPSHHWGIRCISPCMARRGTWYILDGKEDNHA